MEVKVLNEMNFLFTWLFFRHRFFLHLLNFAQALLHSFAQVGILWRDVMTHWRADECEMLRFFLFNQNTRFLNFTCQFNSHSPIQSRLAVAANLKTSQFLPFYTFTISQRYISDVIQENIYLKLRNQFFLLHQTYSQTSISSFYDRLHVIITIIDSLSSKTFEVTLAKHH